MTNIGESEEQLSADLETALRNAINAKVIEVGKRPEDVSEALIVDGNRLLVLLDDGTYLQADFEIVAADVDQHEAAATMQ